MPKPSPGHRRIGRSDGPLATVFASAAMARLVVHFLLRPASAFHFQHLKRVTGLANRSLQLELARLEHLGLVQRSPDGRVVRYRARRVHPGWKALRAVVSQFADPAELLRVALAGVPEVDVAFVYGSFAQRSAVHAASDVDVMVVGGPSVEDGVDVALAPVLLEIAGLVDREINVTRYTWEALARRTATGGRFVRSVLSGAKHWLVGDESMLSRAPMPPAAS